MKYGMHWLAALTVLVALVAPGCSGGEEAGRWLSAAGEAHRESLRLEQSGDREAAARVLGERARAAPPEHVHPEDARVVRQDLYFRLATVELAQRRAREAVAAATLGLALGQREDVFTANLLVVRGQAQEQLGDSRAASSDYHEALLVNEALLEALLPAPRKTP